MQPMITDTSLTVRNAGLAAPPGQYPPASPMPPPAKSQPATGPDHSEPHQSTRTGPLRSGNPRGNPNLAPRCGAKARTTGCPCLAPAMPNGRCRLHGGKSTGPRTPQGLARLAAAHTTHGRYAQTGPDAALRAEIHLVRIVARRARLHDAAYNRLPWLPEPFATRLRADTATELYAPPYPAQFAPAIAASEPNAATCPATDLPPPGHTKPPRRDTSGRFAPPTPEPLHGRQAERARARAEASALAPWRRAVAQARIARRQARHEAPPPHAENAAQHPTQHPSANTAHTPDPAHLRQGPQAPDLQFNQAERNAIHRETALRPTEAHTAVGKIPAKTLMQRGAVAHPAGPDGAAGKIPAKTLIQRGTVAPPGGSTGAARQNPAKTPMQRGAARPGQNPFRNALLSGTVSNSPDAHKLAAAVQRAGGWQVMRAIEAAMDAGTDWRQAAAEVRRRIAQDATRHPAHPSTPPPAAPY